MITFFRWHSYLLKFTLASLWRRKGKNLTLLFIYVLIIFFLATVMLYSHALRKEASIIVAQSPEIIVQRMVAGRHAMVPKDYLAHMGKLRGVTLREGRLWSCFFDAATQKNYTMMATTDLKLEPWEVVIGAGIAHNRGVAEGDRLSFHKANGDSLSYRVKQIVKRESALESAGLILMSEETYRQSFEVPSGHYTDLVLSVPNSREVRKIAEKLLQRLPDSRPILREEIERTYDSIFAWRQVVVFILLAGAIMAFVIFVWEKASGLSAAERREIGILKAVGWETGDILRFKFLEGGIISLTAFGLGCVGAYFHVFYYSASLFEPVLKGWAVLYPDFHPHPYIDGLQLATLFFFTVFPYTIATIIPIWRSSIIDPDAVMR
jgi:ABC-type lipoprotein release transport system permease subunit